MRLAGICALVLLAPWPLPAANKARDIWKTMLKSCAENDLLGDRVLYFGPSNDIGVGTILRKRDKGYGLRYRASDLRIPPAARVISRGKPVTCSNFSRRTFRIGGSSEMRDAFLPQAAAAWFTGLGRARQVTIAVKGYRWDTLVEGVFENWLRTSAAPAIREDIYSNPKRRGDRMIVTKALWLSGLSAEIAFDRGVSANLRAGIPAGPVPVGQLGFAARVRWQGEETLVLETTAPFFIGGEISELSPAGIRGDEAAAPVDAPLRFVPVPHASELIGVASEEPFR